MQGKLSAGQRLEAFTPPNLVIAAGGAVCFSTGTKIMQAEHGFERPEPPRASRVVVAMSQTPILAKKVRQLLRLSLTDKFNKSQSAHQLRIARSSAIKYIGAFKNSALSLDDIEHLNSAKLAEALFPGYGQAIQSDRKAELLGRFASIHARIERIQDCLAKWRKGKKIVSSGTRAVALQTSSRHASRTESPSLRRRSRAKRSAILIDPADTHVLKRWRLSRDRREWEAGIALLEISKGISALEVSRKIERARRTVEKWCLRYEQSGVEAPPSIM